MTGSPISSRDRHQARLQLDDCRNWADMMKIGFTDLGAVLFDRDTNTSAYVLQCANGRRIYSLSSSPNALAGKRGHVTLDEFALHQDLRLLYSVAKPVTMWGGEFSIISTPRGSTNLFWQIVRSAKEAKNSNLNRNPNPDLNPPSEGEGPVVDSPTHSPTDSLTHSLTESPDHQL